MKVKKSAVRAVAAGTMMVLFLFFFLDINPPLTGFLGQIIKWIQLFPALLSAISGDFKGLIAFFMLVLLCLVFGRIYCAFLCPLGVFQDAMIFLSRSRGKPQRREKPRKGTAKSSVNSRVGMTPCAQLSTKNCNRHASHADELLVKNQGKSKHAVNRKTSTSSPSSENPGHHSDSPKHYLFLWYSILVLTTTLVFAGSLMLVNIVDPFSVFGRFAGQLVLPFGATINNLLVSLSESVGQYIFYPVTLRPVLWPVFWITYGWFVLVIFMSFYHGRLYCNTLCPVGAFFGLFSRCSLFGFVIDRQKCTTCGKCKRMCRSRCVDLVVGKIDGARCVSCFDCVDVCPENAISYTITSFGPWRSCGDQYSSACASALISSPISGIHEVPVPDTDTLPLAEDLPSPELGNTDVAAKIDLSKSVEKRKFLFTAVSLCGGMLATAWPLRPLLARMALVGTVDHDPVTPPGSLGLDHFSHTCLACHACVSACPENVLLPGFNGYGLTGALQPRLDFFVSRCAYTCHACTLVCPSGAILPLSLETKQRTRIGSVRFERHRCLVYSHKRDCGACAEVCPTHAVHTIREDNIHHPRIRPDACIGCGACQLVCPVTPKAIYVVAARVHEKAEPPFFQQDSPDAPAAIMGSGADFPF